MIQAPQLLADLTRQLKRIEDDLRTRIGEVAHLDESLRAEWQAARDADRCAEPFETWVDQVITQAGVHWLLSCVFLRFIEDNQLVDRPWLAGTPVSGRLALARDRHEAYFRNEPHQNDRDYLLAAFTQAGQLPGLHTFFDEAHNPVFRLGLSGEAAMGLRQFWQQIDPATGTLVHDFTDATWNTRFLGDLYQDLSEATRKRYALLQTPEFVEEFILDRTLSPAIREFGFREVRMIDPTCGSGHFLLGGFARLVDEWLSSEPDRNRRDVAQMALDSVAGVDLNPFAVAIARFRLLVAALQVGDVRRLTDAPNFKIHVAIGDSLLHGTRFGLTETQHLFDAAETHADTGLALAYASEDLADVQRILGRQYHAVVGNPPYIVVKDAALNAAYRRQYASCHMKYSLGAPFTERFFELAVTPVDGMNAGYVGLITANSFMKREFGSRLIEQVLPRLDLTHVIDTSGAYIPGHGTPTVILFGRHRAPMCEGVRTAMGIKGEPSTPQDPSKGLVWTAIVGQIDQIGSESDYIGVADTPRQTFAKHPWSIGGGGVGEVREELEAQSTQRLLEISDIGIAVVTLEDEAYQIDAGLVARAGFDDDYIRGFVIGDAIRDWSVQGVEPALFPHARDTFRPIIDEKMERWFWPMRTGLSNRQWFKKSQIQRGLAWFEYGHISREKFLSRLSITYAEIATHNHFVLDRGGKVFKQTAPVIKLPSGSNEDAHLGLLGLLNSSVVGFWMKQVSHQKQMMGGDGIRISEKSKVPFQFASTRLQELPLPSSWQGHPLRQRLIELARQADTLAQSISDNRAAEVIALGLETKQNISVLWEAALTARQHARSRLIFIQEEIDFVAYHLYGLVNDQSLLSSSTEWDTLAEAGCRPFCILSQKNVEGFDVPSEVPREWPEELRELWSRRMAAIRATPSLQVIEDPHYKRRWIGKQGLFNHGAKANEFTSALANWMLTRLEAREFWQTSADQPPQLTTTHRLADAVQRDDEFMQIAALYSGHADFDPAKLVADLVAAESVPFLPVHRYTDTGLRKRAQWQDTWALQRREDVIDAEVEAEVDGWRQQLAEEAQVAFGTRTSGAASAWIETKLVEEVARQKVERKANEVDRIPVPPKYQSKDFNKAAFWRLRGDLDVPKERWVSYPGCERGSDTSLPIAWAGWNHLQQATALAGYFLEMKDNEGWDADRLQPLLAGLDELVPWLQQWHNELDSTFGERMGDYYAAFVRDEARGLGFTLEQVRAWQPVVVAKKRGRKKST